MRQNEYDEMHALESRYWWFAGMREITAALLRRYAAPQGRRFLDVGCGTGINLLWAARDLEAGLVVGCDYSRAALGWCRQTLLAAAPRTVSAPVLVQGDVRSLPVAGGSFDVATILDVLDQFPPDGQDLLGFEELCRVLRPGGVALVREPAYQWLLSSHDHVFETRHRYTAPELASKMTRAGFQVLAATYANTILFPLAVLQRGLRIVAGYKRDRTDTQPWPKALEWLDAPFKRCLGAEADWLGRGRRLPFGLSAICIARKP